MNLDYKYPAGRDYVIVVCDVCEGEFFQKDVVLVTDKYNHQYGLVVCRNDLDQVNEQDLPNNHTDRPISNPEDLRPERTDEFSSVDNDDRLPSAPRLPFTQVNPINDTIDLFWQGPEDCGSSGIIGYKIVRASPQLGEYDTVSNNTGTEYVYYQDTSADVSAEYSYKVAAINSFGTGAYSTEFYWPTKRVLWEDINYLAASDTGNVIITSDTLYPIRLNHTEAGTI